MCRLAQEGLHTKYIYVEPLPVADPDIQLRGGWENLICFPESHVYFFIGGGHSLQPNWKGETWPDFPTLDPPLASSRELIINNKIDLPHVKLDSETCTFEGTEAQKTRKVL